MLSPIESADHLKVEEWAGASSLGLDYFSIDPSWFSQIGQRGMSFMVRCRNESSTIALALKSISRLKIPWEAVVVDNCSTDNSQEEAKASCPAENLRIFEYPLPLSRAGIEEYLTPPNSCHSLTWFNNWCMSKCRYSYIFRFDADFVASKYLLEELEALVLGAPVVAKVRAVYSDTMSVNNEPYIQHRAYSPFYYKYVWWECLGTKLEATEKRLSGIVLHDSSLLKRKPYTDLPPWFDGKPGYEEMSAKYKEIKNAIKFTVARASDPESDSAYFRFISLYDKRIERVPNL